MASAKRWIILATIAWLLLFIAVTVSDFLSRPRPLLPPETSAGWQPGQISLTGEWYPSVAFQGAAESLEDYLTRTDLSTVPPRTLTLYLDHLVQAQILPEHREAYERVLDEITARAQQVCAQRGITVRRGKGGGGSYRPGSDAEPRLVVTTGGKRKSGMGISIANFATAPYSRVEYARNEFRGSGVHFISEEPWPHLNADPPARPAR